MVISRLTLFEEPEMTKYSDIDIVVRINPSELIDDGVVKIGDLDRMGFWDDDVIIYLYISPNKSSLHCLVEQYFSWRILETALPKLIKVIELSSDKFIISHPNIDPAENIIQLRDWLLRIVHIGLKNSKSVKDIISEIRDYYNTYTKIQSPKDNDK